VGAYIDNSPIYFALRGAERVYVVKPHPIAYYMMLKNIKLSNVEGKIIPVNIALASKLGNIKIDTSIEETHAKYYSLNSKIGGI